VEVDVRCLEGKDRMALQRLNSLSGSKGSIEIKTSAREETIELGRLVGSVVPEGTVVSLEGSLGSGKTVFAKGFCLGLGVKEDVLSPSFILVEEYRGIFPVYHFDLYRLEEIHEVEEIGLLDYIDGRNIVIIEWGDRLPDGYIEKDIIVGIEIAGENERIIRITAQKNIVEVVDGFKGQRETGPGT